jgi:uroporphyrin-3 C-methyltransferase
MTNDTPKEGVVIDVTPEQESPGTEPAEDTAQSASDKAPPERAPRAAGSLAGLALLLAGGAILLSLAGGWYGYRQLQQLQDALAAARSSGGSAATEARKLAKQVDASQRTLGEQLTAVQSDVTQLSAQLDEAQGQFADQQQQLTAERSLLDERETELRQLVAGINERVGRSGNQWLVAEADYLLHLADYRLRLAADPATAREALALADQRLHATGDPGWSGVRAQIARDLTALDTLEQPDITGLWSRLGALIDQVPNLKPKDAPSRVKPGEPPPLAASAESEERTWRTLLHDLWQGIKNAVRIRRSDEPVAALLPPEEEYFLYENLRLKLEQGRLALVQGRGEVYQQSLTEARSWLTSHFATGPVSRGMDNALAELLTKPISVSLPDLSASLRALKARRELLKSLPATTPSPAAEAPPA